MKAIFHSSVRTEQRRDVPTLLSCDDFSLCLNEDGMTITQLGPHDVDYHHDPHYRRPVLNRLDLPWDEVIRRLGIPVKVNP